jgi:L-serine dehydratase
MQYDSIEAIARSASEAGVKISDAVLSDQTLELGVAESELVLRMERRFDTMLEAASNGSSKDSERPPLLCGADAETFAKFAASGASIGGPIIDSLITTALSVATYNACMGKIVAAPTAGSCGILPAVLITALRELNKPRENVVRSLFTAGAVGMVIASRATLSGAEGGCQAECGSASAMAAAALTEICGGTPDDCINACAFALKSQLGLVCDPVAGLVEAPCIKRNATGAALAWTAADMALSGIRSVIPADEVIDAMKSVGDQMPACLRETSEGGLAATPTGCDIARRLSGHGK